DKWIYHGGFYLISFVPFFTIASVVHPSGFFAKFLGTTLFFALGKRSYRFYFWHYPVIFLLPHPFLADKIPHFFFFFFFSFIFSFFFFFLFLRPPCSPTFLFFAASDVFYS
ncbi:hypothetical protein ACEE46_11375, partial [Staphylococcus chromogenes]